jgi:hypothetical protein
MNGKALRALTAAALLPLLFIAHSVGMESGGVLPSDFEWNTQVHVRGTVQMRVTWRGGDFSEALYPAVTLKDAEGYIAAVFVDDAFCVNDAGVSTEQNFTMRLPDVLPGGAYGVYLSVGDLVGTPLAGLPLAEGEEPDDQRYHIGGLDIEGDYDVFADSVNISGTIVTATLRYVGHSAITAACSPRLEFFRADVPWRSDLPNWRESNDFGPYSTNWTAAKRNELNEQGQTTVTMASQIPAHCYGKTYALHASLNGNDLEYMQGDFGRTTVVALLDVSASGAATARALKRQTQ